MKPFIVLSSILCLCIASEASAQEPQVQANDLPSSSPVEFQRERSPQKAFLLSLLGSAVPMGVGLFLAEQVEDDAGVVIFAFGATLGPSFGHFYSGCPGRGLLGIGIRGGAMAVTLVAASSAILESEGSPAEGAMVAGFLVFCASGIIDIATAPASARKTNRELEEHRIELRGERMRSTGDMALGLQYRF